MLRKYLKKYLDKSFITYGIVGVVNTIFGYSIMFGLTFLGVMPEIANALSYGLAFVLSYILNKKFTFSSQREHKRDFTRFAFASGIAYGTNLLTLIICYRILLWNEYIALLFASIMYVIVGYMLHKFWTFR